MPDPTMPPSQPSAEQPNYDRIVRDHLDSEARKVRPFCGEWPFATSDLDLVMPEHNDAVHQARGCCDGPSAAPPVEDHTLVGRAYGAEVAARLRADEAAADRAASVSASPQPDDNAHTGGAS